MVSWIRRAGCFLLLLVGQITVYIGKRDFIDYLSHIDPIGKWQLCHCFFWKILLLIKMRHWCLCMSFFVY